MPGRMELISRKPMIVVDGAHNPAGVRALVATLDGAFHVEGTRRCILGMLTGREIIDMVTPLVELGVLRTLRERRAHTMWPKLSEKLGE